MGDTLFRPISAVNYRKVLLRDEKNKLTEDYISIRSVIGSITDIKGNEIKIKVPFLYSKPHPFIFRLRHNIQKEIVKKNSLFYFLLIERAGIKIPEVFEAKPAEMADVIAHCMAFELYKRFINKVSGKEYRQYLNLKRFETRGIYFKSRYELFYVCSIEEAKKLFDKYKYLLYKKIYWRKNFHNDTTLYDNIDLWDYIFNAYLSPYFRIDHKQGMIYYFPPIFRHDLQDFRCEKILEINKIIRSYAYIERKKNEY